MSFGKITISAWAAAFLSLSISMPCQADPEAGPLIRAYVTKSVKDKKIRIDEVTSVARAQSYYRPYPVSEPKRTSKEQSFPSYEDMSNVVSSWAGAWKNASDEQSLNQRLEQIGSDFSSKGISGDGLKAVANQLLTPTSGRAVSSMENETRTDTAADAAAAAAPAERRNVSAVRDAVVASSQAVATELQTAATNQTSAIEKAKEASDKKFNDLAAKERQAEDMNRQAELANAYNQGQMGGGAGGGAGAGAGGAGDGKGGGDNKGDHPDSNSDSKGIGANGLDKILGQSNKAAYDAGDLGLGDVKSDKAKDKDKKDDLSNLVNPVSLSNQAGLNSGKKDSPGDSPGDSKVQLAFTNPSTPNRLSFANSADIPKTNPPGTPGGDKISGQPPKNGATDGDAYPDTGNFKDGKAAPNNFVQGGIFGDAGGDANSSEASQGKEELDESALTAEERVNRRPAAEQLATADEKAKEPGVFKFRWIVCGNDLKDVVHACKHPKLHQSHALKGTPELGPLQAGLQPG